MWYCDGAVMLRSRAVTFGRAALILSCLAGLPVSRAMAQQVLTQPTRTVTIARGASALVQTVEPAARLSIADPNIADATAVSPREILITAKTVGTTSLLIWDRNERVSMFSIVVAPDIGALQREIATLFPGVPITLSASGNAIVISGSVRDPSTARRLLEVVRSSGATVIDNMAAPTQRQVLLHVRFAEVDRSALLALSSDLFVAEPQNLGQAIKRPSNESPIIETLAEGLVRLFLIGDNGSSFEAVIRALRTRGHFRSLAEPNLVAMEGEEASFLAGGEFPFPMVQAGGSNNSVTVQFKEFGVRLKSTPFVTNTGSIRLRVAPEVSSLDFANGLTMSGFQIPALLTRRAETVVELRPGQHFAIAGLLNNTRLEDKSKIPILGDLPIIGTFFSSTSTRDNKTELLVVVTPHLVEATDTPPVLPTGEAETWKRSGFLKGGMQLPAGTNPPAPVPARTGNN